MKTEAKPDQKAVEAKPEVKPEAKQEAKPVEAKRDTLSVPKSDSQTQNTDTSPDNKTQVTPRRPSQAAKVKTEKISFDQLSLRRRFFYTFLIGMLIGWQKVFQMLWIRCQIFLQNCVLCVELFMYLVNRSPQKNHEIFRRQQTRKKLTIKSLRKCLSR